MSTDAEGHEGHVWLTISEVAARLRFHPRTIQRYVNQGLFDPVLRSSEHSVRISLASVQAYEHNHLKGSENA
jgi:hypothetical protein